MRWLDPSLFSAYSMVRGKKKVFRERESLANAEQNHRLMAVGAVALGFLVLTTGCQNAAPDIPSTPDGPSSRDAGVAYFFSTNAVDPDGDSVAYRFSWGDGDTSDWTSPYVVSGQADSLNHAWQDSGVYIVRAQARDKSGAESEWSDGCTISVSFRPGVLKWRYATRGKYLSSPAIADDGTIYFIAYDIALANSFIYAVNQDGTLKARYRFCDDVAPESDPVISSEGTIYVLGWASGPDDANLYLFSFNPDGMLNWRYYVGYISGYTPALGADRTIYMAADNYVLALNSDSTLKWYYRMSREAGSSPAVGPDGTVYVGCDDGSLYALNPDSTLKWRYETGRRLASYPVTGDDGTIYFRALGFEEDAYLYAVSPEGVLKWVHWFEGGEGLISPIVASDGTIYASVMSCSFDDVAFYVYALDHDGTFQWRSEVGWFSISTPALASDGTIYVGGDTTIFALNPDGSVQWRFETGGYVESPTIGGDGTVYAVSSDGGLYALTGFGPLADAPWPKLHHDLRNTGRAGGP